MTGTKITIDDSRLKSLLGSLSGRCRDLTPPLQGWGNKLLEQTREQFEQEVDPEGQAWASLAPSTLVRKRKMGYPDKVLTATGMMRGKIGVSVGKKSLKLINPAPYAEFHQKGTRKMPQREILGIGSDRLNQGIGIIRTYIKGRK